MNVHTQDKTQIELMLEPLEAERLLDGLETHGQLLGAGAVELAQALRAAGVSPASEPAPPRKEYMPPLPD